MTLRTGLTLLNKVESGVTILCYGIATTALLLDILLREVFATSTGDLIKVSLYTLIAAGVMGLGLATASGNHIRPKFADGWMPQSFVLTGQRIGDLLAFATYTLAAWLGVQLVALAIEFEFRIPGSDVPLWIPQCILGYAFLSNGIRHLFFALDPSLRPEEADAE